MQCSQKVGQKKWSHNFSQKTSRTSTPTPPLLKGLLRWEFDLVRKIEELEAEIAQKEARIDKDAQQNDVLSMAKKHVEMSLEQAQKTIRIKDEQIKDLLIDRDV